MVGQMSFESQHVLRELLLGTFVCFLVFSPLVYFGLVAFLRLRSRTRDAERGRTRDANKCWGCGYDLRHSTEVCPECGREIGF
jgi:hypothetical protein